VARCLLSGCWIVWRPQSVERNVRSVEDWLAKCLHCSGLVFCEGEAAKSLQMNTTQPHTWPTSLQWPTFDSTYTCHSLTFSHSVVDIWQYWPILCWWDVKPSSINQSSTERSKPKYRLLSAYAPDLGFEFPRPAGASLSYCHRCWLKTAMVSMWPIRLLCFLPAVFAVPQTVPLCKNETHMSTRFSNNNNNATTYKAP